MKDCYWRLMTLKIASAQVVETSLTNNSLSQDSSNPDDHFQSRYVSPGLNTLILLLLLYSKPLFLDTYSLELVSPPKVQTNPQGPIQILDT